MIITSVSDLRARARRRLPRVMFDYADCGSYDEITLRRNRDDLAAVELRQRVLVDLSRRSLATTLAGEPATMPVAIAPTGLAGMFWRDGEIAAARAAEEFGVPYTLSTLSICSIEDVRAALHRPFWFQLYLMRDRGFSADLLARALAAGCTTLMLTLDLQVQGLRRRDLKNGLSIPPRLGLRQALEMTAKPRWVLGVLRGRRRTFGNLAGRVARAGDAGSLAEWIATQFDPSMSWSDLDWVRARWPGKLIVKGILDAADAVRACAHGVDGIVVSNHGGRQLDGAPSTISVLPEIVDAVAGRTEVLFDGGILCGQDVLKALAFGARGCLIGKAHLYGLAAAGGAGVHRVLELLRDELGVSMALTGPEQPMRQWVLSFPFQLRFLFASRPEIMGWVLGIVYRVIATHLVKKAGHTHQVAKTGAVTLIQRFGSALNLNVHFHMLFLDGVYVEQSHGSARFRWVKAPTSPELTQLTHTIAHRVGRYLERQGLLERDVENSYLASDAVDDDPMTPLLGHSITYRIAVGSQAGRKVFTLQTLPTSGDPFGDGIGKVAGSSLHAGVAARADERKKLERLCRYISRPAVSEKRLSLTRGGNVRYQLKTPYRDGTTHVIFEPLDFIARLAALVPKPRVNLTRFHGVFAPNSRHRALVTPAKRGRGNKVRVADEPATPAQRRASMTWAQRLKRVFNIDIETCSGCGGAMKVIACIEDPIVIKQILDHLKHKAETSGTRALPESRAPPAELLLGLFD